MSISFPPLPEPDVSWVDGVDQWGYDDYSHAYSADAMHAHAAAVTAAARDCRTCRNSAGINPSRPYCMVNDGAQDCTNADRYDPLPPVRLWRTT